MRRQKSPVRPSFADEVPNTVNNFVFLAQQRFFNGLSFHRVLQNFVIQTGDPTATGTGGPGYSTNDEPNQLRNTKGTIAMAKAGTNKFFGSQWFVNLNDNSHLDFNAGGSNEFYPFAEVTSGWDVVLSIGRVPVNSHEDGPPVKPVTITTIEIRVTDNGLE